MVRGEIKWIILSKEAHVLWLRLFLFSSVDKADKGMNGLHRQAAKLSGSKSLEQGEKALPQAS